VLRYIASEILMNIQIPPQFVWLENLVVTVKLEAVNSQEQSGKKRIHYAM
jgi:hypothetical protein